jgi:MOSC domain-containing protein YiiM
MTAQRPVTTPKASGSTLAALLNAPMRPGTVRWIGLRPKRHAAMLSVHHARLDPIEGLIGDHYLSKTTGNRHLTLIGQESLSAIASYLRRDLVPPEFLRRNVVISGLNLLALKTKRFYLGEALLEMTGECHPCSRMEVTFGEGGYNAVRGNGGITARVIAGGMIHVGDQLQVSDDGP